MAFRLKGSEYFSGMLIALLTILVLSSSNSLEKNIDANIFSKTVI